MRTYLHSRFDRYHRRVDSRPGTDVQRRDVIRRASIPLAAITPLDVDAGGALLAGVARIHENHWNTPQRRLVLDEAAELPESPVVQATALTTSGRNPSTDAFEVFKKDTASGAFCRCKVSATWRNR